MNYSLYYFGKQNISYHSFFFFQLIHADIPSSFEVPGVLLEQIHVALLL